MILDFVKYPLEDKVIAHLYPQTSVENHWDFKDDNNNIN